MINNKINKFFEDINSNHLINSLDDFDRLLNIFITRECIYRKIDIDAESICIGMHNIIRQYGNDYFNNMTPINIYKYSSAKYMELKIKDDYRYYNYYKMFENPHDYNEGGSQTFYNNPETIENITN
jgi:hypothetical protein